MCYRHYALSLLFTGIVFVAANERSFGESTGDWTRFRGPNGTGIAPLGQDIPSQWTLDEANWKVGLPGKGHAQPVFWGERIFLRGSNDEGTKRFVFALRVKDGSVEWTREFDTTTQEKHELSSYASSTPTVDADRVYVVFGTPEEGRLHALDHEGKDVWTTDLGAYDTRHGFGASPILLREMVIVSKEVRADNFVAAFDRKTGNEIWKLPRESTITSYSTPCIHMPESENPQIIFNSTVYGFCGVDALTGKAVWQAKVFDKRTVSSPVLGPGLVIGTTGSGGGGNYLVATKLGGHGDVTESHFAYKIRKAAPYVPTPIIKDDRLFLWNSKGIATCVKVGSGKVIWQKRVGGQYYGSPIWLDGRLFCLSHEGEIVVIAAADEFKLLGRTDLGEESHSTPAVYGGRLYLRTLGHLYSVGGEKPVSGH